MAAQPTFIVMSATPSVEEFDVLASQAARLKARGRVEIGISSLRQRSTADLVPGLSTWHDYTSSLPALEKFFPHRDLEPFVDREHVARNQELLRAKLPVLRRHKLSAAAQFHIPWMLPEPFFDAYPHLRGPRIDHPRRSRREAYAICVDHEQGRSFYADMFARFAREVPELSSVHLLTNDAGAGLCWADWQYIGPNGPGRCRDVPVGQRVRDLIDALRAAAESDEMYFDLRGNFSPAELRAIRGVHDEHFAARSQHGAAARHAAVGPQIDNPVLGIIEPISAIQSLQRTHDPHVNRVVVDFSANYSRGHELHDVQEKVIDLIDAYFARPPRGLMERLELLRSLCQRWVGPEQADTLLEAFHDLHEAQTFRAATIPLYTANYAGVSMRHITRPLVPLPEKLTPEEESYWLPHVFNPSVSEARSDYCDFHGGRLSGPAGIEQQDDSYVPPVAGYGARMHGIAQRLERLESPGAEVFRRMGASLRIHASILRSIGNFFGVQRIRDRNAGVVAAGPRVHAKRADWTGNPDLQRLNELLRDELDNTVALIELLQSGGIRQVLTASDPADEDTFLLGPDLIGQLKHKCRIMRRHWIDAEPFLAPPHK